MNRRRFLALAGGALLAATLGCSPSGKQRSVDLLIPAGSETANTYAQILQSDLANIGMKIEIRNLENATYTEYLERKEYTFALGGLAYDGDLNDWSGLWALDDPKTPTYREDAYNYAGIDDPIMRGLFDQLSQGKDVRKELHDQMLKTLPYIMLNQSNILYAANPKLKIPWVHRTGQSFQATRNIHQWSGLERVVISTPTMPRSMQPNRANLAEDFGNIELVYNGLMGYDTDGNVVPELAEKVEITGSKVHIVLRPDVVWHDNHKLTVDDVLDSIRFYKNDPQFYYQHSLPTTVTARGEREIDMEFAQATSSIPYYLTNKVLPKGFQNDGPIIGTGPYKFKAFNRSSGDIHLDAHDAYFGGRPTIRQVVIRYVPDSFTQKMSLLTDALDFSATKNMFAQDLLKDGLQLHSVPAYSFKYIAFNTQQPPFDDLRVRQAVAMAIDKATYLTMLDDPIARREGKSYLEGIAIGEAADSPFMQGHVPVYDLARARMLIEQNGFFKPMKK